MSFGSFFSDIGKGIKGAVNTVGSGLSSIAKPVMNFASSVAPIAGAGIGGMVGGPGGALIGSQIGNAVSSFAKNPSQAMSQAPSQLAGYMQDYIPEQYRNMNLGQMGQQFSGYMDSHLPGSGQYFNQAMSLIPQNYLNSSYSSYFPSNGQGGGQPNPYQSYQTPYNPYQNSGMPSGYGYEGWR